MPSELSPEIARELRETEQRLEVHSEPPPIQAMGRAGRVAPALGVTLTLVLATAVVAAISTWRSNDVGSDGLPYGLFVGDTVVGSGPIENVTCAAVQLPKDAPNAGSVQVFWWTTEAGHCGTRTSGITEQTASLKAFTLPSDGGVSARRGYVLSFSLGVIPEGRHEVRLILDPAYAAAHGLPLAALRAGDIVPTLRFRRAEKLAIPGPDGGSPLPTPQQGASH